MQLVGLKAVYVGDPLPNGVKGSDVATSLAKFTKIMQPYKGGVTTNFSNPTATKFYREGESNPFFAIFDPTTGEKNLSWTVADFDDTDTEDKTSTMTFYFGTTEPQRGEMYEGEKAFCFVTESGKTLAFARLKYAATLTGGLNTSDPLQISVTAEVLAPTNGGVAWWPIDTPDAFKDTDATTTSEE